MKATGSLMMILNGMQVDSRERTEGGVAEGKGNKESDTLLISKSLSATGPPQLLCYRVNIGRRLGISYGYWTGFVYRVTTKPIILYRPAVKSVD